MMNDKIGNTVWEGECIVYGNCRMVQSQLNHGVVYSLLNASKIGTSFS